MELNHLRVFFEVAKAGRFTEAARNLNISQSALSRSVALLEENQGVQLLERSKQGVKLTPVGLDVFQLCQGIFENVGRIEETCRGTKSTCEGPLRLAASDHVLNYLLMEPLNAFRAKYPKVVPGVRTGSLEKITSLVIDGECEFGLLFWRVSSPRLEIESLREEPMALVVHPAVWRSNKGQNHWATLNKVVNSVGYISSAGMTAQTRTASVLVELFGKAPRIGFETDDQEAQKRLCMAKGGVAYLARFMVEREIESGQLHEIKVESPRAFHLWLLTRKGHVMSLSARTFLAQLRAEWR